MPVAGNKENHHAFSRQARLECTLELCSVELLPNENKCIHSVWWVWWVVLGLLDYF